jgi:hypothetical protein
MDWVLTYTDSEQEAMVVAMDVLRDYSCEEFAGDVYLLDRTTLIRKVITFYGDPIYLTDLVRNLSFQELDEADRFNLEYIFKKMKQLGTPRESEFYSPMFAELYRTDREMETIIGRVFRDGEDGLVSDDEE